MLAQVIDTNSGAEVAFGIALLVLIAAAAVAVLVLSRNVSMLRRMFLPDGARTRRCPHCRILISALASVCSHCRRESKPWFERDGYWCREDEAGGLEWYNDRVRQWVPFSNRLPGAPEPSGAAGS